MKALLQDFIGDQLLTTGRPVSLAVIYEDSDTHEQAEALYDFLLKVVEDDAPVTATWWRTSILTDPKLARVATRAVASSDLVMLSIRTDRAPAPTVVSWMESWPLPEDRPTRLLSLLYTNGHSVENSDWEAYLENLAHRRELLYFPASLSAIAESAENLARPGQRRAEMAVSSSRPIEPYAHWGLNE